MDKLLSNIRACDVCKAHLPLDPKPIVIAHPETKIALISQAPGRIAHLSGIPWDDPGGRQLKKWLNVSDQKFYNPKNFAIVPIGFCYPGKGKSGDLPPRPECAPLWHQSIFNHMQNLQLVILIGQYAQKYYLKQKSKRTVTDTVSTFHEYLPTYFPLPHPSPRNRFWLTKNPWFDHEVLPALRKKVKDILV